MVTKESIQSKKRIRSEEEDAMEMNHTNGIENFNSEMNNKSNNNGKDGEFEFEGESVSPEKSIAVKSVRFSSPRSTIKTTSKTTTGNTKTETFSYELLSLYYSKLFPYDLLHQWLSYDPSPSNLLTCDSPNNTVRSNNTFTHREFSFTIEPTPNNEVYIRYQSYSSLKSFKDAVCKRVPRKIDIGAVFSHPPKDHKTLRSSTSSVSWRKFHPEQRELVFDVDLTDYDDVRKCGCVGADICGICWKMMGMAIKVMDRGLKEDFGFRHVAWFYSGRRGVHAWICDESARALSDEGRSAVAKYFEVNMNVDETKNLNLQLPLHPSLERAHNMLEPLFIRDILPEAGHGVMATPSAWNNLLDTLPIPAASSVVESLKKKWLEDNSNISPAEKWTELKRYLQVLIGKSNNSKKQSKTMGATDRRAIELWPITTVFRYTYPRLDINVSKMQNHLLKSPFCVHPKTGRVCIPMDVEKVEDFDPFAVPTLGQLIEELDNGEKDCPPAVEEDDDEEKGEGHEESGKAKVCRQWEKTSLKEPFQFFEREILTPMLKDLGRKLE